MGPVCSLSYMLLSLHMEQIYNINPPLQNVDFSHIEGTREKAGLQFQITKQPPVTVGANCKGPPITKMKET